ncbi:dephospho-CoA kinase [Helicobacter mustelae]|uniref:Dephospho-CoA kinase n=1 Tax=Helicobacter mustelae (strain ATCC 43772 / CCUG 25715 / CIP 103759 / LMG 18044 / NCTC 12198 / R85-136P) TaxID=679897 RepID=D3UH76_HELM1|nr:dephospho-CoA kinase [Helicobacter mustelae]CBG39848.1 putative dephospho-CoA kinase [Helicobacter mustelae 12198]SQH71357.1 dephospho-CoA kinase [Helicobacter mustelae]
MQKLEYGVILTGGIASGKSTAIQIIKSHGYDVIDADSIAHDILDDQSEVVCQIFGEDVMVQNRVDRKKLGAIVFGDASKRVVLESFLHPKIFEKIKEEALGLEKEKKIYFLDIPLYFETQRRYEGMGVVCIYVDEKTQLARLMQRNVLSVQEAMQRISAQMSLEKKRECSDFVIDNSGSLEWLRLQVLELIAKLELLNKNTKATK